LLLRKPEFQELFNSYYYSIADAPAPETIQHPDLKEKDKKASNKRTISAFRRSSQQEK